MVRKVGRVLGWIAGRVPTVLAWAGLAALFAYGAVHGWKFDGPNGEEQPRVEAAPGDRPDGAFTPYYLAQPFDVPVLVTHDPERCAACGPPRLKSPPEGAAVCGAAAWVETPRKTVTLKSPEVAAKIGLRTAPVGYARVSLVIAAHGEVVRDPTATAKAAPRVGGTLFTLEKQLGDPVRRGELLALVDAAEVGRAKAAYLTATAQFESREQVLASLKSGVAPPRSVVEAEAAVREAAAALYSARQGLANLGLPTPLAGEKLSDGELSDRLLLLGVPALKQAELRAQARESGEPLTANLLPVVSPLDGVVTRRDGVAGEAVPALHPVYEVGDPARVFVFLDVRQEDLPRIAVGQRLTFRPEGGADRPAAEGTVDWVSPAVDERTRTVRVRGRVPNPGGVLRAGAFGAGEIIVEPPRPALVVPRDAVHWEGCSNVVFVKVSDVEFAPRRVVLGVRQGPAVEVTDGLAPGDEVVVGGSHVLKNELLKDRIGEAEE